MENLNMSLRQRGRAGRVGVPGARRWGLGAADSPSFPLLPQSHRSPAYRTASDTMTEKYGNPRSVRSVSATMATCCAMT